jgi:hypothetical protein
MGGATLQQGLLLNYPLLPSTCLTPNAEGLDMGGATLQQGLLLIYPLYLLSSTGDHVSGNHFNPFDRKLFESSQTLPAAFR